MMLRGLLSSCLFGLVALMGVTNTEAATLKRKGPVLVNYGNGYVAADNGAGLQPGHAVMAKQHFFDLARIDIAAAGNDDVL